MRRQIATLLTAVLVAAWAPLAVAQQTASTNSTLNAGGWVDQGGGTNLHLAIDDPPSDADYIWSDTDTQTAYMGLSGGLTDPNTNINHTLRIRAWAEDKANQTGQLRLYENSGGTLIATWSFTIPSRRAWTDLTYTLTGPEANAISQYNGLSIRIENTDPGNREIRVSWFQFEVPNPVATDPPTLTTPTAVSITHTQADLGATITSDGGATISQHGTVWDTAPSPVTPTHNPSTRGSLPSGVPPNEIYSETRTGMPSQDQIFYRGYATNSEGTSYSPQGSFWTEPATHATLGAFGTVTTDSIVVNWSAGSGVGRVVVMSTDNPPAAPVDGTVYSDCATGVFTACPAIGNTRVIATTGTSRTVTGLAPSTTYWVAVYEHAGTVADSGVNQGINYKTGPTPASQATDGGLSAPTLSAPTADGITHTQATLGATIASDGGATVTQHGTVWNTTGTPVTPTDSPTTRGALGSTTIAAGSDGQSLPQATINVADTTGFLSAGTITVVTSGGAQTVTYTGTTATSFTGCSGGTGTMTTGGAVTQANVVYSETRTGLPSQTRIFYRGYATNTEGTSYSPQGSFWTEPATQVTIGAFGTPTANSIEINWTPGSGDGSLVVISATDPPTAPTDGVVYTASPDIGSAGTTAPGSYVVATSGSTVTATGLASSTTYYVAIYEYAGTVDTLGDDQGINYKPGPATGNDTTDAGAGSEPTVQASSIVMITVTSKALVFEWTPGNGDGSIVVMRVGGPPPDMTPPADTIDHPAWDNDFSASTEQTTAGEKVVYVGSGNRIWVYGLTANTTYYIAVYAYGGSGAGIDYLATSPATATQATDGPATHNYDNYANCNECHNHGGAATGSAFVPSGDSQEAVCTGCHKPGGRAAGKDQFAMHTTPNYPAVPDIDCGSCHEVHKQNTLETTLSTHPVTLNTGYNLSYVRSNVQTYVTTANTDNNAVFQVKPDDLAIEDGTSTTSRGLCQACHSAAGNHRWDGTGDQCHNGQGGNCGPAQTDCFLCHTHVGNFAPTGGDCTGCHNSPQPVSAPTRRTIVQEFNRASSHVPSADLVAEDCEVCHAQEVTGHLHGGEGGTDYQVTLFNADDKTTVYQLGTYATPSTTLSEAVKLEPFCLSCHDGDAIDTGLTSDTIPFKNSIGTPANIAATWSTSSHATKNQRPAPNGSGAPTTCFGDGEFGCHASAHGSLKTKLLAPDTTDGGTNDSGQLEGFCLNCHTASGASSIDINAQFGGLATNFQVAGTGTNPATYLKANQKHDVLPADQAYSGAVMTCTDCHNPHAATADDPVVNPDDGSALNTYSVLNTYAYSGNTLNYSWDTVSGDYDPVNPQGYIVDVGGPTLSEPDYVEFCLVCHDGVAPPGVVLPSGQQFMNMADVYRLNDKHGRLVGSTNTSRGYMKEPWATAAQYSSGLEPDGPYAALNCTLCHSPHGTGNIYHLRESIEVAGYTMTVGGVDAFVDPATCPRNCDNIFASFPDFGSTTYTLPLNASSQQEYLGWGPWCTFCHEPSHGTADGFACQSGHRHGGGNF